MAERYDDLAVLGKNARALR
jgi:hypothetical protein